MLLPFHYIGYQLYLFLKLLIFSYFSILDASPLWRNRLCARLGTMKI